MSLPRVVLSMDGNDQPPDAAVHAILHRRIYYLSTYEMLASTSIWSGWRFGIWTSEQMPIR